MGILEDLQARVAQIEEQYEAFIKPRYERLKLEHEALVRNIHAVEDLNGGIQHDEIAALGRRLHQIEETVGTFDSQIRDVVAQGAGLSDKENHLGLQLEMILEQEGKLGTKLSDLRGWQVGMVAWYHLPWWQRWWLELTGRGFGS